MPLAQDLGHLTPEARAKVLCGNAARQPIAAGEGSPGSWPAADDAWRHRARHGRDRRRRGEAGGMPPQQFAHVALMLGYPLEVDLRNLEDVRAEIFRIAGVWKSKGTSNLVAAVCSQIFGVRPRVQEGAGRVLRCADPDLYDRVSPEDQQIGG